MATIQSLADEYGIQPHELCATVGWTYDDKPSSYVMELAKDQEAWVRDIIENTDDSGLYRKD